MNNFIDITTYEKYIDALKIVIKNELKKQSTTYKKQRINRAKTILLSDQFVVTLNAINSLFIFKTENYELINENIKKNHLGKYLFKIIKQLILKNIIHEDSDNYPTNNKNFRFNAPENYILKTQMSKLDFTIDLKDEIISELNKVEYEKNFEIALYLFLKYFELNNFTVMDYLKIDTHYQFNFNDNIFFIVNTSDKYREFNDIRIMKLSKFISKYIIDYINYLKENIFFNNDKQINIFNSDIDKKSETYLKRINTKNIPFKQLEYGASFLYMKENSTLSRTLKVQKNYPYMKIKELIALNIDVSNHILELNKTLENKLDFNKIRYDSDIIDDNLDIELTSRESFREMLKKLHLEYSTKDQLKTIYLTIKPHLEEIINESNDVRKDIFVYIKESITKLLRTKKQKSIDHFKLRHSVLYRFLFRYLLINNNFDENSFVYIKRLLLDENNKHYSENTKRDYLNIINSFLKTVYNLNFGNLNHIIEHNRSMIFQNELDILLNMHKINLLSYRKKIEKKYNKLTNNKKRIIDQKVYQFLQPIIFYIIQFHTGMRPTETRTRLMRDWVQNTYNSEFSIDVNTDGCYNANSIDNSKTFTLKNYSATRRIEFVIPGKYIDLVNEFYNLATSLDLTYMFQDINTKSIVSDKFLQERLDEIKNTIDRNCDIYSFRHSYMTYSTKKILEEKGFIDKRSFINLSNMMGHSTPSTSIENYLHIDLLDFL